MTLRPIDTNIQRMGNQANQANHSKLKDREPGPPPFTPLAPPRLQLSTPTEQHSPLPAVLEHRGWMEAEAYREQITEYIRSRGVKEERDAGYDRLTRAVAVDWLVGMSDSYKLTSKTLFLAAHLLDQCSQLAVTPLGSCYLAVTCLHIASKYEEVVPVSVHSLIERAWRNLETEEVYHYQKAVLEHVDYALSPVLGYDLAMLHAAQEKLAPAQLAELNFLLECSLFSKGWEAGRLAAESLQLLRENGGKRVLVSYIFARAQGFESVIRKYGRAEHSRVSRKYG